MNQDQTVELWSAAVARATRTAPDLGASPADRRAAARLLSDTLAREFTLPAPDGCLVSEATVDTRGGEIRVLRYRPAGAVGDRPAHLFLHGGGFVTGTVHEVVNDRLLRRRALTAGCDVFAAEYRLAPEHPFPAALEDCVDVLDWVFTEAGGVDTERVGIGGASSGGNLAALAAIEDRDSHGPRLRHQLLEVPAASLSFEDNAESYQDYSGLGTAGDLDLLRQAYLGTLDPAVVRQASPLAAPDLSGLPPTLVITAEFDPLRDSGEAFARRLEDAGVPVELLRLPGQLHDSCGATAVSDVARAGQEHANAALRTALTGS